MSKKIVTFQEDNDFSTAGGQDYAVAVFAASSMMKDPNHARDAEYIGRKLAEKGYHFIYGGGASGLMGVSSHAALKAGGKITGFMMACFTEATREYPQKPFEQMCLTIAERKQKMLLAADAYIALGGGFGTLDEIIEAGVEQYMGGYANPPLPQKPIILINRNGIYDPIKDIVENFIEEGAANEQLRDFFIYADDAKDALRQLENFRAKPAPILTAVANVSSEHGSSIGHFKL